MAWRRTQAAPADISVIIGDWRRVALGEVDDDRREKRYRTTRHDFT